MPAPSLGPAFSVAALPETRRRLWEGHLSVSESKLGERCLHRGLAGRAASANPPASVGKLRFLFSEPSASNPPWLSLSCARGDQPRVTLSATQGRQSEHDAKPGRKSRVASGSPKESEDLGMETIKGKPELVRNSRPAPAPPPPCCSQSGSGAEGHGLPVSAGVSASPLPPRPTVAWRGRAHRGSRTGPGSHVQAGGRARLDPPVAVELERM